MKKTILFSVLLIIVMHCNGQSSFGIFAGPQTTFSRYTVEGVKQDNQYKQGGQVGFGWKIPFENHLFFSPAAFYSLKGYKVTFNRFAYPPDTGAINNNTTLHTFELAFLLQLDIGSRPAGIFIKAGPSLDFQLFGKEKFDLKAGGMVNRNMVFSFGEYGRYSVNLLVQSGYETASGFTIFGQYTLGLASINNADAGPQIRHRAIGISIGKYFNKRKIVLDTRNKE